MFAGVSDNISRGYILFKQIGHRFAGGNVHNAKLLTTLDLCLAALCIGKSAVRLPLLFVLAGYVVFIMHDKKTIVSMNN